MSRKDYKEIAACISGELDCLSPLFDQPAREAIARITRSLASSFYSDNHRFDRQRFYFACSLDEQGKA